MQADWLDLAAISWHIVMSHLHIMDSSVILASVHNCCTGSVSFRLKSSVHLHCKAPQDSHCVCAVCRINNQLSANQLPAAVQRYRHLQRPSHRRANSAELPPLSILPPPIFPNSPPSADIDLDVDYQSEVAPVLGECLVGLLLLLRLYPLPPTKPF